MGYCREVQMMFKGNLEGALRMFLGYLKEAQRVFQENFDCASRMF